MVHLNIIIKLLMGLLAAENILKKTEHKINTDYEYQHYVHPQNQKLIVDNLQSIKNLKI